MSPQPNPNRRRRYRRGSSKPESEGVNAACWKQFLDSLTLPGEAVVWATAVEIKVWNPRDIADAASIMHSSTLGEREVACLMAAIARKAVEAGIDL